MDLVDGVKLCIIKLQAELENLGDRASQGDSRGLARAIEVLHEVLEDTCATPSLPC